MIERGRAKDLINATNKSYEVINISSVLQKSSNYFRLRYRNEFEDHEILQPYLKNLRNIPLCCKTAPSNYLYFFLSSRFIFHASSVWKIVPINVTKHVRIWLKSWYQKILSSGRSKITLKLHILLLPSSALSTTTFLSLQQQLQLRNRLKKVYCVCLPI